MHQGVLHSLASLTEHREVDAITFALLSALVDMFPARRVALWQNDHISHKTAELYTVSVDSITGDYRYDRTSTEFDTVELSQVAYASEPRCIRVDGNIQRHIVPLYQKKTHLGGLVIDTSDPIDAFIPQVEAMARVFTNYLTVLIESERDQLTGLNNRRSFDARFHKLIASAPDRAAPSDDEERRQALGHSTWLATCDVDHFKRVNDTYGHVCGDEVLLKLAQTMRATFRENDHVFRFGGEEFVILLKCPSARDAMSTFNRFRKAVETQAFPLVGKVTISIGVTEVDPTDFPAAALERSDQALYYSKENGRNRTSLYEALVRSGELAPITSLASGEIDLF